MPYIDFTRQAGINNKGSVGKLTNYLQKEDRQMEKQGKREFYFDHERTDITKNEVDKHIDTNRGGLKKKDAKFYMITINPSKEELAHIGNDASKFKQWIQKEYIPRLAKDFNREGLKTSDLNIYGKIEYHRYYKGTDKEVQQGLVKSGDAKPGVNMHCHLILGRKSKDKKHYLSPNANAKKQGQQGAAINAGFDRNSHKIAIEKSWDRFFGHERGHDKSFEVQQELKQAKTIVERASIQERYEVERTTAIGEAIEKKDLSRVNGRAEKEMMNEKAMAIKKDKGEEVISTEKEVVAGNRAQEKTEEGVKESKETEQEKAIGNGQEKEVQTNKTAIGKEQVATEKADSEELEIGKGIEKESPEKERTIAETKEKLKEEGQEIELSEDKIEEGPVEKAVEAKQENDIENKEQSIEDEEKTKEQEKDRSIGKDKGLGKKQDRPIQKNDRDQGMGMGF